MKRMKRTILMVQLLLVGVIATAFTSCLGEGENSREAKGEFVYITTINGVKVAAFSYGYLQSEELNDLSAGDCALIDYKVNYDKSNAIAYLPNFLIVDPLNTFPVNSQFKAAITDIHQAENGSKYDAFRSIVVNSYNTSQHLGDRWLFYYDYMKVEGEDEPQLQVYYNPEAQSDDQLKKGIVILDCVLSRVGGTSGNATSEWGIGKSVVDFSRLRAEFKNMAVPDSQYFSKISFQFRYFVPSNNDQESELKTQVLTNSYYLLYTNETE